MEPRGRKRMHESRTSNPVNRAARLSSLACFIIVALIHCSGDDQVAIVNTQPHDASTDGQRSGEPDIDATAVRDGASDGAWSTSLCGDRHIDADEKCDGNCPTSCPSDN